MRPTASILLHRAKRGGGPAAIEAQGISAGASMASSGKSSVAAENLEALVRIGHPWVLRANSEALCWSPGIRVTHAA